MSSQLTLGERDELLQRAQEADAKAQESQVEAAAYRNQLIECEELAKAAIQTNNPSLMHGLLSKAQLTLNKRNVKEWGRDWKHCWEMDIKWLKRTLRALEAMKTAATQLSVTDSTPNAAIKVRLVEVANEALVQHVPSSVSLDDLVENSM